MQLTNIKNLYSEMKINGELRQRFVFEYNGIAADVFFFIDSIPFILAFGVIGTTLYFEIEVKKGFEISTIVSKETYDKIVKGFNIQYSPDNSFKPSSFFQHLNNNFPQHLAQTQKVNPISIAHYMSDIEEANRLFFIGFRDNSKMGSTVRNLDKTLRLMGNEAYILCKAKNLSTRWTDDKHKDMFEKWKKLIP